MSNKKEFAYLALFFDAPMQSWGMQSSFDSRTTLPFPSRSAVTGMIGAALGVERGDQRKLAELAQLELVILGFSHRGGVLINDFHTVGGGAEYVSPLSKPISAEGAKRSNPVVSHREYLTDAKFGAVLTGDPDLLNSIAAALDDPRWGVWFGRKSCIPCSPVGRGVHATLKMAIEVLSDAAGKPLIRILHEVPLTKPGARIYPDIPQDFAVRKFRSRAILEEVVADGNNLP